MNILAELWFGNVTPGEQEGYWTEERKDLATLCQRNADKLAATLNDDEKQALERLRDCHLEMQQYAECNAFVIGFRLGVQLMAASMAGL